LNKDKLSAKFYAKSQELIYNDYLFLRRTN